jgi:tRNA-dihydrouridine synthase B
MAGITDAPFRALAWRFGAGYVVCEMVSAQAQLWHTEKSRLRRQAVKGIRPCVVQIAGGDALSVAQSAIRHWRDGADIIDINFGCPAKKVCRKAAGSQLLKDESLVAEIIGATVRAVPIPVTVKIRTGYSREQKNGVAIARIAEAEGASAIAVHGRTRACRFLGDVEHETVGRIKTAVAIPVFANGDIDSVQGVRRLLAATGVDGVMIGRAALGAPWLPGQIAGVTGCVSVAEKLRVVRIHVAEMQRFYGVAGVRVVRKHVKWYLEKLDELGSGDWRRTLINQFNRIDDTAQQLDFLAALVPRLAA